MKTLLWALALTLVAWDGASSHDFWINGKNVDPITKKLCCGESDCKLVPTDAVHVTSEGYKFDDVPYVVPMARAQVSPDGKYWRCIWGGEVQCFFAPPFGV